MLYFTAVPLWVARWPRLAATPAHRRSSRLRRAKQASHRTWHRADQASGIKVPTRELVITVLRLVIEAIAEGNTTLAAAILDQVQPESPDNTAATVAGCIGTALGLLDDWLTGSDQRAPKNLSQRVQLPAGHWLGERAATDILVLARKGRAFRSLDTLITRQGGKQVLYGSALTLAATIQTWSADTGTPVTDLTRAVR